MTEELKKELMDELEGCENAKKFLLKSAMDEMLSLFKVFQIIGAERGLSTDDYINLIEAAEG